MKIEFKGDKKGLIATIFIMPFMLFYAFIMVIVSFIYTVIMMIYVFMVATIVVVFTGIKILIDEYIIKKK